MNSSDPLQQFVDLHAAGSFIIPNFWDPGSAIMLERLGFDALASTSAGFAQSIGKLDGQITLEEKLQHLRSVCDVIHVPVNADFEHGFADSPEACAANLTRAAECGIAGASIEDWSRTELYDASLAAERISACAEAVSALGRPFVLTARAENLLRGELDLDGTITRLQAYEKAGADVLYAPGLSSPEQISAVVDAVSKPINVLAPFMPQFSFERFAALGVRRVSIGNVLANYATGAMLHAANRMLEDGDFTWAMEASPGKVIQQLLA